MKRRGFNPRDRMLTTEELARYLFGDPMDPNDVGVIGRMMRDIVDLKTTTQRQVQGVLRLGWAILIVLFTALVALVANLTLNYLTITGRPHP